MAYQIDRYNGEFLVTVDDGTIDQTTDIKLVGKNYAGYGEIQNENFIFLLQNFASGDPGGPPKKLVGQIWFDSANKKLKFWDGLHWKTTGGSEVTTGVQPSGLVQGDFWWNSGSKQLFAFNGPNDFVLVGPQSVTGFNQTNLESLSVQDSLGNAHPIIRAMIGGSPIFTISVDDAFTIGTVDQAKLVGFSQIRTGITLVNSSSGVTSTLVDRFWGTSSDSDRLGGLVASDYILKDQADFTDRATFPDAGVRIGDNQEIYISILNNPKFDDDLPATNIRLATIKNNVTSMIAVKVTSPGGVRYPALFEGYTDPSVLAGAILPGANNKYDIGSSTKRWRQVRAYEIWADTIHGNIAGALTGTASQADTLLYNAGYRSATDTWSSGNGNTIVARNASGDFTANVITAVATRARYGDLAEKYAADSVYEPGTVVVFGGDQEITLTDVFADTRVAGVISTNPAYIMNEAAGDDTNYPPVALRGKVPVKVIGKVTKGDVLVTSTTPGYAVALKSENVSNFSGIAKSLENKDDDGLGVVMAVVI
jgi:hypothetical protein